MASVDLPSAPESVAAAVRFVEAIALEGALPQPVVERMLLATSEAVSNAIEHGNGDDPARFVRLVWTGHAEGGEMAVEDEGGGLTLQRVLEARLPADPYQTSGRGLFLIRMLADRIEVEGARLRLWFTLRPEEAA